jgi:hypothetical protein
MTDISSISASVAPPVSVPSVSPAAAADSSVPDNSQDSAATAAVNAPATYTVLATESASNIRGVGVDQSA